MALLAAFALRMQYHISLLRGHFWSLRRVAARHFQVDPKVVFACHEKGVACN